ncbi:MAG TPA: hypothetical protein VIS06_13835 [Mycobacteriales bacterium]
MDDPTRPEPPGPTGASDLVELARRASDLWQWAGRPSEDELRSAAEAPGASGSFDAAALTTGIVSRVLDGSGLTWGDLEPFVVACLSYGNRSPERIDIDLGNWRTTWAAVESADTWATGYDPYPATEPGPTTEATQYPVTEPIAVTAAPYPTTEPIPAVTATPYAEPARYPTPLAAPEPWVVSRSRPSRSSRRLPVIIGAVVSVAAVVAVGITVVAASHSDSHPTALAPTASGSNSTRPDGMALPAQAANGSQASASAQATFGHATATSGGASSANQTAPGGVVTSTGGDSGSQPGGTSVSPPPAGTVPSATTKPTTSSPSPSSQPSPTPPPPPTVCTSDGSCAGKAYFVANGEHLWVCDRIADGYGAVAQYTRTDVPLQNNEAVNSGGAGTCIDHNMNMPEGAKITFRVCLKDGSSSSRFSCGPWKTAVS